MASVREPCEGSRHFIENGYKWLLPALHCFLQVVPENFFTPEDVMEHIPEFYKKTSIGITMFGQMVNVYLLGMRVILGSTSPRSFIQPYRAKSACKDQRPAILISHKLTWLATQRLVNSSLCAKLNLRDSFTKICWGCYENLPTVFCTNFVFSPEFSDNFKTSGSLPKIHPDWLENLTSKMLMLISIR